MLGREATTRCGMLALAAALVLAVVAASANATTQASASVPRCSSSLYAGAYPHPDCVFGPFKTTDAGAVTGTVKLAKLTKLKQGRQYVLSVAVTHQSELTIVCPNPTPTSDIPCHNAGISVGLAGKYVPKAASLGTTYISDPDINGCADTGPCVRHYYINATEDYGRLVLVFHIAQGEITKDPGNDLGSAGFEAALTVTIPQFKNG